MAAGEASEILALHEFGGTSLAPEQRLLTPFQRIVVLKEAQRQQEEAKREQALGSNRTNPAHGSVGGSKMQGETVTYVNENTNG